MFQKIKDFALPIAVIAGVLSYRTITVLVPIIPALVFTMLLLSFCSVSPREMRFTRQHACLLLVQVGLCLCLYALFLPFGKAVAQGVFLCALMPTAAAASAIAGMLGGRVSFEATFVFLDNVMVAVLAPLFFTWFGDTHGLPFGVSVWIIAAKVVPVLVLPLLLAWALERVAKSVHGWLLSLQWTTIYMWIVAVAVSAGQIMAFLIDKGSGDYMDELIIAAASLVVCLGQFRLGRLLGRQHRNYVGAEQALGQKNTVLAIWMAQTFLNPIAAVGPGAYHLWQSCVNSYQLYLRRKRRRRHFRHKRRVVQR